MTWLRFKSFFKFTLGFISLVGIGLIGVFLASNYDAIQTGQSNTVQE